MVSITFDDAYDDLYDNALPLLLERDLPFTVFVSTELVGKHHYLTWAELKEMQKKGATIANHTHSHTHLLRKQKNESDAQWRTRVTDEIEQAQYLLDKHLDNIPRYLAYPYGEYSMQLLKIVSDLQFVGFGQQSGAAGSYSSMLLIPRFPVSGVYSHLNSLSTKLLTKPMPTITPVLDPLRQVQIPELRLEFPSVVPGLSQLACYGPGGRTQLVKLSDTEYVAKSSEPIPIGRSRYNCTMPSGETGRFYWYSQLWIRKNEDGSWYLEP